ncbi:Flavin-containing monooxygenase YUCCA9 [Mycena venus]|uniref:Flavin-containing monooxygenase YUCCA9 n=1 Tax=Mycena venus TaxID=2733690 RepID=A0A8H7CSL1_9AGAR|nr:Flavin-containing monooxygenase YUCCA9 [Mycena venus]
MESAEWLGVYDRHTLAWPDIIQERCLEIEQHLYVLLIGAGQTGLNVAACFKQINIPTLIVEKNHRVGDNWRERYPTLTLYPIEAHYTSRFHVLHMHLPKFTPPYHHNWPIFKPHDKLAHSLEHYAESNNLVVRTNSIPTPTPTLTPTPTPTYDPVSQRWTVVIDREGKHLTFHPAHIVFAAGTLGALHQPSIHNTERCRGITPHTAHHHGGAPFAAKRVVVIGTENSAADICQDFSFHSARLRDHGAALVDVRRLCGQFVHAVEKIWPADVPMEVTQFKQNAMPFGC